MRAPALRFAVVSVCFGLLTGLLVLALPAQAAAGSQFPAQQANGSIGVEGTISTAPPSQGPTITTPGNGASFNDIPVTVNGLCPKGLLVKLFSNNVFVGSVECPNGSYSLQIDLFSGQNDLVARAYDALDQSSPDSNTVTVIFNDAHFIQFGTHVSLTSNFAKRGADPGQEIDWPVILSGGVGPYAISADWGDGSPTDLMSEPFAGDITLKHVYKTAGTYRIIVKATDKNGGEAFLQLAGVANGAIQSNTTGKSGGSSSTITKLRVLWWPALAMVPLILAAFWVGRRHELISLRQQLEKSRDQEAR